MKYKVVKDSSSDWGCRNCVGWDSDSCDVFLRENNLPDCVEENCHFELADEITTTDLKEIDEAREERQ